MAAVTGADQQADDAGPVVALLGTGSATSPRSGDLAFRAMINLLPCAAVVERDGMIVDWNLLARRMSGCNDEEPVASKRLFVGAFPLQIGEHRQRFDCLLLRPHGRPVAVSGAVQPVDWGGGRARLIVLLERMGMDLSTDAEEGCGTFLEDLLDSAPEAMAITHRGCVLHVNREFVRLFGYSKTECIGTDLDELVMWDGRAHETEMLQHTVKELGRASIETVRRTRSGLPVDVSVLCAKVLIGGDAMGLFVTFRDIREQKRAEEHLRHTSLHDGLTSLANRTLFTERVRLTMSRLQRRPDRGFAILFIDLDGFKQVNDTLGHAAGDALLLTVGRRLQECLRPQDTVARFGGDEFAVLLDEASGGAEPGRVAERIQAKLQRVVPWGEAQIMISASIGIVLGSAEYGTAEEMVRDADLAMYRAKSGGRGRHVYHAAGSAGL
jgi:Amt family ammonium transporter